MKKIHLITLALSVFIIGCAKKEDNQTANVGEIVTTEAEKIVAVPETKIMEGQEIEKDEVHNFIADKFFYGDKVETDFATYMDEEEIYHIKVLAAKAYSESGLSNLDSIFEEDKNEIEEIIEYVKSRKYPEDEVAIIETEYDITNISSYEKQMACRIPLSIFIRVPDERGIAYGLSDKRISSAMAYSEFWTQCVGAEQGKMSMDSYDLNISAGETIKLKCVYITLKKYLQEELYLGLCCKDDGEESKELKCKLPTNNELTKFLRLPVVEG